jgi:hypothetical protein
VVARFDKQHEETLDMINQVQKTVVASKEAVLGAIAGVDYALERMQIQKHYDHLAVSMCVISLSRLSSLRLMHTDCCRIYSGFFTTNAEVLKKLTPGKGHETLAPNVKAEGETELTQKRTRIADEILKLVNLLEARLSQKNYKMTREYVELYMMSVTWMLVFDKVRSFEPINFDFRSLLRVPQGVSHLFRYVYRLASPIISVFCICVDIWRGIFLFLAILVGSVSIGDHRCFVLKLSPHR